MMLSWQKLSVEQCSPQAEESRSKGGLGEGWLHTDESHHFIFMGIYFSYPAKVFQGHNVTEARLGNGHLSAVCVKLHSGAKITRSPSNLFNTLQTFLHMEESKT